jgi:hypothetical protein
MRAFSISERKILESSNYVAKITPNNQIQFTDQFKELVLTSSSNGLTREEHFNFLLKVSCFDKKYVDSCLNRWRRIGSTKVKKGRKKSIHKMTIEELKAENAYQKEVIAHLKKLRGLMDDEL